MKAHVERKRTTARSRFRGARLGAGALLAALAMTAGLAPTQGCMSYDVALQGDIRLSSQVNDWRDEVIYQILVDRFADDDLTNDYNVDLSSPGHWHGGDWKGIEDHLDYIQSLGVTTLWISPIVKNVETDAGFDGYHGYWAQDLTSLNPHFGDLASLRSLVFAAHKRRMKIIVDIVTNHLGQLFFYDINKNGQPDETVSGSGTSSPVLHESEYDPDFDPRGVQSFTSLGESGPAPIIFFHDPVTNHMPPLPEVFQNPRAFNKKGRTLDFSVPDQLVHGDFPGGLKDVNTTLCQARDGLPIKETMVDVYARWVELTDIDGFRIDTVKHVEREFWRYFAQKLRQRLSTDGKGKFLMFGEAFDGNDQLVGAYTKSDPPAPDDLASENQCVTDGKPITGDQLDSVFYFPQYYTAINNVFHNGGSTDQIQTLWESRATDWGTTPPALGVDVPPNQIPINFIDNHDVSRFLFGGQTVAGLQTALTFVFTAQGIPCVYYGTEQEFSGGNDPGNRENLWPTGFPETSSTFKHIQKLTAIRKASLAIRKGDVKVVWSTPRTGTAEDAGIFAFERMGGDAADDFALIVLNASFVKASAPTFQGNAMTVDMPEGTTLTDALGSGKSYTVGPMGRLVVDPLAPQSSLILLKP